MKDTLIGILGLLLLIGAGVLGEVLPEDDFIPDQFLVTYDLDANGTKFYFTDPVEGTVGQSYRSELEYLQELKLPLVLEKNNVIRISLEVFIPGDDHPSSLQDRFRFELEDPNGNLVGEALSAKTAPPYLPTYSGTNPPNPNDSLYKTDGAGYSTSWTIGTAPTSEFLSGQNGRQITREEAINFAILERTSLTKDQEYTLIIKLLEAGGCPQPQTSTESAQRVSDCRRFADDSREDPGNPFTIGAVTAFNYDIDSPLA